MNKDTITDYVKLPTGAIVQVINTYDDAFTFMGINDEVDCKYEDALPATKEDYEQFHLDNPDYYGS